MMTASAPQTIAFAIWGPILRDDLPGLTGRVCALLHGSSAAVALCDVTGVEPDAVTVDALGRLQLAAGRLGCRVVLRNASRGLRDLVDLMGLEDVIPDQDIGSKRPPARLDPEWLAEPPSGSTETSTAS
jgi:ABC-type transporter Mla MlaB component